LTEPIVVGHNGKHSSSKAKEITALPLVLGKRTTALALKPDVPGGIISIERGYLTASNES
jgi:hypothetical protein